MSLGFTPVHVGPSVVMVCNCANGCPTRDLYVVIQSSQDSSGKPPHVCVGCSFCLEKLHRAKVSAALDAWRDLQLKRSTA